MNTSKPAEKLFGISSKPIKYSSAGTRYASLHGFQQDAEFNEVNVAPQKMPGEIDNDWNVMNIKSGVNRTDCPSCYGINPDRGMDKICSQVFTPDWIKSAWRRVRGEPVD